MENFNTDFTDGKLAILNELIAFIEEESPTTEAIKRDFISPKCAEILAKIKIERDILNDYAKGVDVTLNSIPDFDGKSLFETIGDLCRPKY